MENRSLVTIAEHSKEKILYLLEMAKEFEKKPNRKILDGKVVATLFFEPSTRTRLSFETAANRLGARVIGFTDPKVTSSSKGETLKDTIMMVSNYADIIVMRHFLEGAARYASEVAPVPIVNAGDGANQHPSQTMLDLYSIYKTQGTLENLNIYLVGDLKYGRTVHSLLMAMRHFNPTFHFIAPEELKMPEEYKIYCKEHHIKYKEYTDFNEETIADADILYMTRVQRERFTDLMEYERVKDVYILRNINAVAYLHYERVHENAVEPPLYGYPLVQVYAQGVHHVNVLHFHLQLLSYEYHGYHILPQVPQKASRHKL